MDAQTKRMNITSVALRRTGTNKNGKPFAIYDVEAEGVSARLSSFDKLPLGSNEYSVEPFRRDNGEVTYTLKAYGFRVARDPELDAIGGAVSREEFDQLDRRVMDLEATVRGSDATPPLADYATPQLSDFADDPIPF